MATLGDCFLPSKGECYTAHSAHPILHQIIGKDMVLRHCIHFKEALRHSVPVNDIKKAASSWRSLCKNV